jgi:dolichol-phosphate mannosyltransferase
MKSIDIICPVFNEEQAIPIFFDKLFSVTKAIKQHYKAKVIFIDNNSNDSTVDYLKQKCELFPWIHLICLSKNFGYQASLECGLKHSNSSLTAIIDTDGEDPPEMILEFLREHEKGYEIIYGERVDREENFLLKKLRKYYYRIVQVLADDNFILDMAEFCLITSNVRSVLIEENNSYPFFRSAIARAGFNVKNVPYKRGRRIAGASHYNLWRIWIFAFGGFMTSSTFLLRLPAYLTPLYLFLFLYSFMETKSYIEKFFCISLSLLYFMGVVCCLYLARIYKNSLHRSNFIVDKNKSVNLSCE